MCRRRGAKKKKIQNSKCNLFLACKVNIAKLSMSQRFPNFKIANGPSFSLGTLSVKFECVVKNTIQKIQKRKEVQLWNRDETMENTYSCSLLPPAEDEEAVVVVVGAVVPLVTLRRGATEGF